jgi:rod shape determining protein RodA
VGIVLALIVSRFSFRTARAYAIIIYGVAVVGLMLVLVPGIGKSQGGAQAWIALPGGFTFQPSEFTKVALITLLAMVLTERRDSELVPDDRDVLFGLALAGIPALLVLLQNDFGTVMIIGATLLSVMVVAGVKLRWIYGSISTVILAGFVASQLNFIKDYQLKRLATFVDPTLDPLGAGYNTLQARIAIGSGGWFGQGLLSGPQTQGKYVPAQRTDFIFTVAGEELGFFGSTLIIFLIAMILYRLTKIAINSPDRFGRLAAAGVAGWFAIQTFENIGMNLGIMPVTGVPLPFVSYGGSSMFVSWMALGLVVAIGREIDDRVTPLIR